MAYTAVEEAETAGTSRPAAAWPGRRVQLALVLLLGGAVALAAGNAARHWWNVGRFAIATDDAYLKADIVPVSSEVTGLISEVDVADNSPVRRGAVLMRIDDRDYRARIAQAAAAVAGDEAALANLDARTRLQGAAISGAEAQVAAARADAQFAGQERARFEKLQRSGIASAERAEQMAAADYRQSALTRAQTAGLASAQQQYQVLATEKDELTAALQRDRALLDEAEAQFGRTIIRAPEDGIVGERAARVGAYAQPGQQMLVLVPSQGLYVTANFKETQLRRVVRGMPATIRVDSFPGTEFRGRVDSLAPASGAEFSLLPPENATGNFTKIIQRFPVKILVTDDNPLAARLRPGMSVTATIDTRDSGPAR